MTKRKDLTKELNEAGYVEDRGKGGNHSKFRKGSKSIAVPRHREINDRLADGIRKEAGL